MTTHPSAAGEQASGRKVLVVLRAGDECLLLKRTARWNREWQPVTGHVDEGESFEDAARREVEEETGFEQGILADLDCEFAFEARGRRFTERAYVFLLPGREEPRLTFEHEAHEWVTPEDAAARVPHSTQVEAIRRAFTL